MNFIQALREPTKLEREDKKLYCKQCLKETLHFPRHFEGSSRTYCCKVCGRERYE